MMDKKGFTLIELLVVMIIIGILLSIAGVSSREWIDRYKVEGQTKELFIDLVNARASAMQKSRTVFVTLAPTQYAVYEDTDPGPDGDGILSAGTDTRVIQKDLNSAYGLTIPGAVAEQINFNSRGMASAKPGQLGTQQTIRTTTSFGSAYDCIVIMATRIRMGAWNGSTCVTQ